MFVIFFLLICEARRKKMTKRKKKHAIVHNVFAMLSRKSSCAAHNLLCSLLQQAARSQDKCIWPTTPSIPLPKGDIKLNLTSQYAASVSWRAKECRRKSATSIWINARKSVVNNCMFSFFLLVLFLFL